MSEDQDSKTEDPTQKKLEDALKKGQVVNSKEFTTFLIFTLLTIASIWIVPNILQLIAKKLRFFVENAGTMEVSGGSIFNLLTSIMRSLILYLSPLFAIIFIAAIVSSIAQTGQFIFTTEQMKFDITKLSMIKGFKRIVSTKSFVEFLKGIFKIALVGTIVFLVIINDIKELSQYQELSLGGILDQLQLMIHHILIAVTLIVAAIAGVDFAFQKYDHFNKLKMSKQEVKDEYKQTEGSPEIKQKIRQLRQEQAKRAASTSVPEATVIITNPEHYAVALKFDLETMDTPICVAKGVELLAQRIKQIAGEHDIPIIENPPLARGLYKDVDLQQPIPYEYFEAVAEIVNYIMAVNERKKQAIANN